MQFPHLGSFIVAVLPGLAFVACSDRSPVSPDLAPASGGPTLAVSAPGTYDLEFYRITATGLEKVTSLPVLSDELILGALIKDANGVPAHGGSVTFQYCSFKGLPPNDINRADEAPLQACADGTAKWAFLGTVPVDATGNAFLDFGIVRIPRTVGFRCKFSGKGTPISSGNCLPEDFLWTP
jgi:hypothetical protein